MLSAEVRYGEINPAAMTQRSLYQIALWNVNAFQDLILGDQVKREVEQLVTSRSHEIPPALSLHSCRLIVGSEHLFHAPVKSLPSPTVEHPLAKSEQLSQSIESVQRSAFDHQPQHGPADCEFESGDCGQSVGCLLRLRIHARAGVYRTCGRYAIAMVADQETIR